MIDYGLLMSVIVAWAASSFAWRVHPPDTFDSMVSALDVLLVPGFVGLVVGRLSTLALDDPRAIGSISVSYTHLRAHETVLDLVCRLLLEKKRQLY